MTSLSNPENLASSDRINESIERIIDAALEELAQSGPTRARMSDIADRANVSSATLYRRFTTKQDLLQAVLIRETERFVTAMREVALRQETAEETVLECFAFGFEYLIESNFLLRLIQVEPELVVPQFTTKAAPLLEAVTSLMMQLNRENIFVEADTWKSDLAAVRMEMVVRLFISLLLTEGPSIDVSTPAAAREFARLHVVPMVVQADSPQVRRPGTD
ncbi:MAG: TetR/AcrR family transcriptional regulator [Thermoleophilaceae bacterium]|nr:TetR/AcrR family transcriptional regulator [Thermoleophilaceae bacterium]